MDIYSAQLPIDEKTLMAKAEELKSVTTKDIWPRVNINRIYQRKENNHYYSASASEDDVRKMLPHGMPVDKVRKAGTSYFNKIKCMDINNDTGALADFYQIWTRAVKFSHFMKSGVVLDLEDYNSSGAYDVFKIAEARNEQVDEVIKKLIGIGVRLADIVEKEYPDAVIITFFFDFSNTRRYPYYQSYAYIAQGILMRAKEKSIPLKLVEGGEGEINYVNKTIDILKAKINKRLFAYTPWLERFPANLRLGGTITIWDDQSKISGWTKLNAGTPNPFQSMEDFTPFLKELFKNYDYIWFYQPMCIDYSLFNKNNQSMQDFHDKLGKVIEKALEK